MIITTYILNGINYLRCLKEIRKAQNSRFLYYSSVCAMAKNEEDYLIEWIDHNLKIGFEHIYLIDNNDKPGLENLLFSYIKKGVLTLIPFLNILPRNQTTAYTYCLDNYGDSSRWMAFIDVDEFFFLTERYNNINEFLLARESFPAIGVNWLMFGSDGQIYKENRSVIERFRKPVMCERNYIFKSIVQSFLYHRVDDMKIGAHRWSYPTFNEIGKFIIKDRIKPLYRNISLHHYFTKSFEEFYERCQRGETIGGCKTIERFYEVNDIVMKTSIDQTFYLNKHK